MESKIDAFDVLDERSLLSSWPARLPCLVPRTYHGMEELSRFLRVIVLGEDNASEKPHDAFTASQLCLKKRMWRLFWDRLLERMGQSKLQARAPQDTTLSGGTTSTPLDVAFEQYGSGIGVPRLAQMREDQFSHVGFKWSRFERHVHNKLLFAALGHARYRREILLEMTSELLKDQNRLFESVCDLEGLDVVWTGATVGSASGGRVRNTSESKFGICHVFQFPFRVVVEMEDTAEAVELGLDNKDALIEFIKMNRTDPSGFAAEPSVRTRRAIRALDKQKIRVDFPRAAGSALYALHGKTVECLVKIRRRHTMRTLHKEAKKRLGLAASRARMAAHHASQLLRASRADLKLKDGKNKAGPSGARLHSVHTCVNALHGHFQSRGVNIMLTGGSVPKSFEWAIVAGKSIIQSQNLTPKQRSAAESAIAKMYISKTIEKKATEDTKLSRHQTEVATQRGGSHRSTRCRDRRKWEAAQSSLLSHAFLTDVYMNESLLDSLPMLKAVLQRIDPTLYKDIFVYGQGRDDLSRLYARSRRLQNLAHQWWLLLCFALHLEGVEGLAKDPCEPDCTFTQPRDSDVSTTDVRDAEDYVPETGFHAVHAALSRIPTDEAKVLAMIQSRLRIRGTRSHLRVGSAATALSGAATRSRQRTAGIGSWRSTYLSPAALRDQFEQWQRLSLFVTLEEHGYARGADGAWAHGDYHGADNASFKIITRNVRAPLRLLTRAQRAIVRCDARVIAQSGANLNGEKDRNESKRGDRNAKLQRKLQESDDLDFAPTESEESGVESDEEY